MIVPRTPLFALVGWTVFLWISRLRNVLVDDDLSAGGTAWRVAVVVIFVAMAAAVFWAWRRGPMPSDRLVALVRVLGAWTIGFWIIRGGGIIIDDHDLGFTVVHTALMVTSISLAVWAWPRRVRVMAVPDTAV